MNKFTKVFTSEGFTEVLEYEGVKYVKQYETDDDGYRGLDKAWEFEESLPDHIIEALESGDELEIMEALE